VKAPTVKLSPYERAVNRLNDLPPALDKIFSAALEDLRKQRDEANARHKESLDLCERYIRHLHKAEAERDEAKRLTRDLTIARPCATCNRLRHETNWTCSEEATSDDDL